MTDPTKRCRYGHGISGVYLISCPGCYEVVSGKRASLKWHKQYRDARKELDRIVQETPLT